MSALNLLTRRDRLAAALAAGVVSLSVAAATLLAFAADGQTEWFAAGSDLALATRRCDRELASTARHNCLREIAQAQRATSAAPTRLARH